MNARAILTNIVSFVTPKMHATRQKAVADCVHSLASGSAATVTSIGRGIHSDAYEKHNIKRADRLLSNQHLLRERPLIYGTVCRLFCTAKHPTISIDWSNLDECKRHFLLRASLNFDGLVITLYEEVHPLMAKYGNANIVDKLMQRMFWQGQSAEQLVDSLGRPMDIDQKVLKTKTKEIWKYNRTGKGRYALRITLEDGEVVHY